MTNNLLNSAVIVVLWLTAKIVWNQSIKRTIFWWLINQNFVNQYHPNNRCWVIIPMAMGKCSAYSSPQADSKVKFAAWPTSWLPPGADRLWPRGTKVNSRIWLVLYRQHYKYRPGVLLLLLLYSVCPCFCFHISTEYYATDHTEHSFSL